MIPFCVWCGTSKNLTREHMIPVALGGPLYSGNVRKACLGCNAERGKVTDAVRKGRPELVGPALIRKWVELEQIFMGFSPHGRALEAQPGQRQTA